MDDPRRLHGVDGLRLLMTTDTVGGVFTYALTLARELTTHGADVHFATMGPPLLPAQRIAAAAIDRLVVHESTFALEWMPDPWSDVERAGEWLRMLEQRVAPDLVHLNGYCHGAAGFRTPVVIVGHSCVLSWWEAVLGEPPPAELSRYRAEVRRGLHGAGAVIAPTRAMMKCLEQHYGPIANPTVVANGVPRSPSSSPRSPRKELAVLAAGRLWDRAKNIEALTRVASRFPGPVRVAGSDALPDGHRQPLPDVETLGWLDADALGRAMEAAAIFAHPARYEPFGLCPVEAAHRGCALVLGGIDSLREVWGDAAIFVDPNDDDALAGALDGLARDGERRREFALRAATRAAAFTPARMAEETAAVYFQLLRGENASIERHLALKGGAVPCA